MTLIMLKYEQCQVSCFGSHNNSEQSYLLIVIQQNIPFWLTKTKNQS